MARVLVVDDDAAALPLRKLILEREGYEVYAAADPVNARALLVGANPEIAVLDLRLPEASDGLALIRDLKAARPAIRIIVLSGWPLDLEGTPEAALVDRVLTKPIRTATLVDALASA
jgi:CheY-like chemotaxis protein